MFSTPKGTHDILPEEWPYWTYVIHHASLVADLFAYRRIETPTFAETSLFARTAGAGSDVVDKEMYTFQDRGGDDLTLRPEGTAPVMRAYLQHGMSRRPQPVRLYYVERMFRYDRPQAGRLREHHQFGCEAIGVEDAYVDVDMLALLSMYFQRLGLTNLTLLLNSIGDAACRPEYIRELVRYLSSCESELAPRDRERLTRNPLRVLDTKETATLRVLDGVPHLTDYLCDACREHWQRVLHGLEVLGIPYTIDPHLVRGLDYYTRTVFEFVPATQGQQSAVASGGRYDALSEAMGGPHVPGVGFGSGIERVVLNLKEEGVEVPPAPRPQLYLAHIGEGTEDAALRVARTLRAAGLPTEMAFGPRSLKAQLKSAGSSGAQFALIIGSDELTTGTVIVRDLTGGDQETVPLDDVVHVLARRAGNG